MTLPSAFVAFAVVGEGGGVAEGVLREDDVAAGVDVVAGGIAGGVGDAEQVADEVIGVAEDIAAGVGDSGFLATFYARKTCNENSDLSRAEFKSA